jgi:Zn-dependent peptidase ImmA (M78 family)/transcriptional regulator with XRE-family HTH domain
MSRQAVSATESGKRAITVEELLKLSDLYRLPVDTFLGRRAAERPRALPAIQRRENARRKEYLDDHDAQEIFAFESFLKAECAAAGDRTKRSIDQVEQLLGKPAGPFCQVGRLADRVRGLIDLETPPINVYRAISHFGLRVRMTALNTISGAFLSATPARIAGVLINSNQPTDRQRFSAAHELGHCILGHAGPGGDEKIISPLGRRFSSREVEADSFSSEFLMPGPLVLKQIDQLRIPSALEEQVYILANRFLVSFQAIVYRLAGLNLISARQKEALLKVRPSEIEAKLALKRGSRRKGFELTLLKRICASSFPTDLLMSPDGVRQLQELAFEEYARATEEAERADPPGSVYEKVAAWVADTYPLSH